MAGRIPWTKIRAEWLRGGTTQKQLAEKYHISVKTIQNRAYKEAWKKQKGKIAEKVEEETRERVVRARVNRLEKLMTANDDLIEALVLMAEQIKKRPGNLFDKTGSLRNAESYAKAIAQAVATQRDLYKLPDMDQKLARDKWKAELKEKKAQAKELSGTVVRIECDEEGALDE